MYKAKNPKTGKIQTAYFIDDFYGLHQYAVAFRKDGHDAKINESFASQEYETYPINEIEQSE
jgi:hypothetical protein